MFVNDLLLLTGGLGAAVYLKPALPAVFRKQIPFRYLLTGLAPLLAAGAAYLLYPPAAGAACFGVFLACQLVPRILATRIHHLAWSERYGVAERLAEQAGRFYPSLRGPVPLYHAMALLQNGRTEEALSPYITLRKPGRRKSA